MQGKLDLAKTVAAEEDALLQTILKLILYTDVEVERFSLLGNGKFSFFLKTKAVVLHFSRIEDDKFKIKITTSSGITRTILSSANDVIPKLKSVLNEIKQTKNSFQCQICDCPTVTIKSKEKYYEVKCLHCEHVWDLAKSLS